MADARLYAQLQPFTLAGAGSSIADTTLTLENFNTIDGTPLTMADFGTVGYGTLEPGSLAQEEQISFTGITTNANGTVSLTGVKNVLFLAPYTETSGLLKSHAGGTTFVISNTSGFYDNFANKQNDETIEGDWDFTNSPTVPTPLAPTEVANKAYVDSVAVAGAPDASTTTKGIVEIATGAEFIAGTDTGGTGAKLVPVPSLFGTSGPSKGLIAKTDGLLDDSLLALTTAGDTTYSDGTDLKRLPLGTAGLFLEAGASAPQWGGANLAEANTFFGATDITGAEAQTLSSGGNASGLHYHGFAAGVLSDLSTAVAGNNDQTISGLTFTPRCIRIHYILQGHSSGVQDNRYHQIRGIAVYDGTTLKFNDQLGGDDTQSDNQAPQIEGTDSFPNLTAAPAAGTATGSSAIRITMTVNSVSAGGFVLRLLTQENNNSGNLARARIAWEAFE